MRNILNFTTTNIWLTLESFYNDGVTPEEAKEVIENLRDINGHYLTTEWSGFNRNLIIHTHSTDPLTISVICAQVSSNLEWLLQKKKNENK